MIEILVTDQGFDYDQAHRYFKKIKRWSKKNCPSFRNMTVVDVSDVSPTHDLIAQFQFSDEKDSVWFHLKWGQSK